MSENDFFICQKKGFYTNSVSQSELNSDAKFLFCPAEENMLINSFFPLYEWKYLYICKKKSQIEVLLLNYLRRTCYATIYPTFVLFIVRIWKNKIYLYCIGYM